MDIVVFSGAGMSAESGIQTFRDSDGLWAQYKIEEIATPEAWENNPDLVTDFYNQRRKQILNVEPNEAHKTVAKLEAQHNVTIITQNIDDLHERAGSSKVVHLHGNIRYAKSSGPNQEKEYYLIDGWEIKAKDVCPNGYRLRPHVVWFGEQVPMYENAIQILENADVLIVIGTSLQVYPAAGLIHFAQKARQKIVVDPNAENLQLNHEFLYLNMGAVEGVKKLNEILSVS